MSPVCAPVKRLPAPWGGISPHFQPIVSSRTHEVFAVEALLRLSGCETNCEALFRRWEATGEVIAIDAAMVRRVKSALALASGPTTVGVNVSALTLSVAPDAYLEEIAALCGVAERVIVEITETFPLPKLDALASFTRQCKTLGALVAFDDCTPRHQFCTPEVVQEVAPDVMKIDGNFFLHCFRSKDERAMTEIIAIAYGVGALVVAEHISNGEMRDWAKALDIALLQGHLFGQAQALPVRTH